MDNVSYGEIIGLVLKDIYDRMIEPHVEDMDNVDAVDDTRIVADSTYVDMICN